MTVIEVLADSELGEGVAARAAEGAGAASPVGTGMLLPVFLAGGEVDGRRLPVTHRDAVEVVADAGVPLRAAQVCQALGAGGEPRHREGMRGKLKRLVNRGWLVEVSPGLFACASGVADALDPARDGTSPGGHRPGGRS